MIFTPTSLTGAYIIEPEVFKDERGMFYRFYCIDEFKKIGHNKPWVQLNHSCTSKQGTIRGMHFQLPPHSEIKMVKCISGKICDTIIDLRSESPTFLKWTSVELSMDNRHMLYIPQGFAHGFQALTDNCELIYHHTAPYVKTFEKGIRWDDPMVNIQWPLPPVNISSRDQEHEYLTTQFSGIKI